MEVLFALIGVVGALSCVGMYAAVSMGYASAERPLFFIVNGVGALLVMIGAWHNFDIGDIGTILQETIWAGLSVMGGLRVWRLRQEQQKAPTAPAKRAILQAVQVTTTQAHVNTPGEEQVELLQRAAS